MDECSIISLNDFTAWAGLVLWPLVVIIGEGTGPAESSVFSLGTLLPTHSEEMLFPSGWRRQDHGTLNAILVFILSTTKKMVKNEELKRRSGGRQRRGESWKERERIPILSVVPYNSFSFL